jgi:hypothetical protein
LQRAHLSAPEDRLRDARLAARRPLRALQARTVMSKQPWCAAVPAGDALGGGRPASRGPCAQTRPARPSRCRPCRPAQRKGASEPRAVCNARSSVLPRNTGGQGRAKKTSAPGGVLRGRRERHLQHEVVHLLGRRAPTHRGHSLSELRLVQGARMISVSCLKSGLDVLRELFRVDALVEVAN